MTTGCVHVFPSSSENARDNSSRWLLTGTSDHSLSPPVNGYSLLPSGYGLFQANNKRPLARRANCPGALLASMAEGRITRPNTPLSLRECFQEPPQFVRMSFQQPSVLKLNHRSLRHASVMAHAAQVDDVAGPPCCTIIIRYVCQHRMPPGIVQQLHAGKNDLASAGLNHIADAPSPFVVEFLGRFP